MTSQNLANDIIERYKEFENYTEVNRHIPKSYSWSPTIAELTKAEIASNNFRDKVTTLASILNTSSVVDITKKVSKLLQDLLGKFAQTHVEKRSSQFPTNFWFDDECKTHKRKVNYLAKLLKSCTDDHTFKKYFLKERRIYKALVRKKKRKVTTNLHKNLEDLRTKNPRTFWKWINEITDQTPTDSLQSQSRS